MNRNAMTARRVLGYAEAHPGASLRVYTVPHNFAALHGALVNEAAARGYALPYLIEVVAYRTPEERMRDADAYEPKKRAEG